MKIVYLAGTIDVTDMRYFEKLVFRTSRGKVLCYFDPLNFKLRDFDGNERSRVVYVLVFQQGDFIKDKVERICDTFKGIQCPLPGEGSAGSEEFASAMLDLK